MFEWPDRQDVSGPSMELKRLRGVLRGVELQLHVDLARLDFAAICGIVERRERESDRVDFKQEINFAQPKAIAADVASMANHLGGLIIFGIAETTEDGSAPAEQPSARRLLPIPSLRGRSTRSIWLLSLRLNLGLGLGGSFDGWVAGSGWAVGAFGASGSGCVGFWWAGWGADGWAKSVKSSADAGGGEFGGVSGAFPWHALVVDETAG